MSTPQISFGLRTSSFVSGSLQLFFLFLCSWLYSRRSKMTEQRIRIRSPELRPCTPTNPTKESTACTPHPKNKTTKAKRTASEEQQLYIHLKKDARGDLSTVHRQCVSAFRAIASFGSAWTDVRRDETCEGTDWGNALESLESGENLAGRRKTHPPGPKHLHATAGA